MKNSISKIKAYPNHTLYIEDSFHNSGYISFVEIAGQRAFTPLANQLYFSQVKSRGTFIEWPEGQDIHLDTLEVLIQSQASTLENPIIFKLPKDFAAPH